MHSSMASRPVWAAAPCCLQCSQFAFNRNLSSVLRRNMAIRRQSAKSEESLTGNDQNQCALTQWIFCEWYKLIQYRHSALSYYSKLSHATYPYTTCLVRKSQYFHLSYKSLFAKVNFFLFKKYKIKCMVWNGRAFFDSASPGFSLETWELRHWDENKILFSSATKQNIDYCSYLYWTGFTLVWLY